MAGFRGIAGGVKADQIPERVIALIEQERRGNEYDEVLTGSHRRAIVDFLCMVHKPLKATPPVVAEPVLEDGWGRGNAKSGLTPQTSAVAAPAFRHCLRRSASTVVARILRRNTASLATTSVVGHVKRTRVSVRVSIVRGEGRCASTGRISLPSASPVMPRRCTHQLLDL